jgi:hypothetical protein
VVAQDQAHKVVKGRSQVVAQGRAQAVAQRQGQVSGSARTESSDNSSKSGSGAWWRNKLTVLKYVSVPTVYLNSWAINNVGLQTFL